jgi:hypothetical protein
MFSWISAPPRCVFIDNSARRCCAALVAGVGIHAGAVPLFHGCPLGRPFLIPDPLDSRRDERRSRQPDRVSREWARSVSNQMPTAIPGRLLGGARACIIAASPLPARSTSPRQRCLYLEEQRSADVRST